jgi:catalase
MADSGTTPGAFPLKPLLVIGATISTAAIAFAYTAGWLTPNGLTPTRLVAALQPPQGPTLGHRRNHAKGICFTGTFDANGKGSELSKAKMLEPGQYAVVGRFNVAGADPKTPYAMAAVRGFGIRITTPDGQEWRSAMIDAPVFAAPTPQAFFEFSTASSSKDPNAFKQYSSVHAEILTFISWVKDQGRTESWSEDPSLDQAIRRSRVVTPGLETGVSGFISYDFCKLAGRVPSPSRIFLLQGASMRCFVSSSIDFGSRFR